MKLPFTHQPSGLTHPARWQRLRFLDHEQLPEAPGIYAVMKGRKILYIGRSKNIEQRWNSTGDRRHGRYWLASLRASHIAYLQTLDYVRQERRYITQYQPPWNDTSYPWFWNCDRAWLGKVGATLWLLFAKRNERQKRNGLKDALGTLLVWGGLVGVGVLLIEIIGG